MKHLIRATRQPQRSFVPIAPFEIESFEVRVRRVAHRRPISIGAWRSTTARRTLPGAAVVMRSFSCRRPRSRDLG